MSRWYFKVVNSNDMFSAIGDAVEYFMSEYETGKAELTPQRGSRLWDLHMKIPGMMEHRYGQLQEIEAIMNYLEIQYDKAKGEKKRMYFEHYNRQLSERMADQYADIEPEVLVIREFVQQVSLVRNHFLGLTKGIESLHFNAGHLNKLKAAGVEDATF